MKHFSPPAITRYITVLLLHRFEILRLKNRFADETTSQILLIFNEHVSGRVILLGGPQIPDSWSSECLDLVQRYFDTTDQWKAIVCNFFSFDCVV